MPETIIEIKNLSKKYNIVYQKEKDRYLVLRDVLTNFAKHPFRSAKDKMKQKLGIGIKEFWALKDISFKVKKGEIVGIIGRNGAGKTTLLKILSRITPPTNGKIKIRGRIASLLEVGTGFHEELTGRENIYLNGAILGMKKREIKEKFNEIVKFSGVEQFLDTPIKRYSRGMRVRLAFSVAAHLEPEILLVDEVLAGGDVEFQRKCLNKMDNVSKKGRTVLFVSHNMSAITRLCERTILLDKGSIVQDGPSSKIVSAYLQFGTGIRAVRLWPDISKAPGDDVVRLRAARVRLKGGQIKEAIDIRRPVGIEMEYEVLKPGYILVPNYHFFNEEGIYVFAASDHDQTWRQRPRPTGRYMSTAWVPGNLLSEGILTVGVAITTITSETVHFYERNAVSFQVVDTLDGDSARGDYGGQLPGIVRPLLRWTTQFNPQVSTKKA